MNKFKEYLKTSKSLIKENKRLQVEFRKNFSDLTRLLRKIRANLPKKPKSN
jgi:hypothetical protein